MTGWHHWLDGHEFEWTLGIGGRPGVLWFMGSQKVRHNWVTELNWTELRSNWSIVSFKVCVSLLIYCLVDLSIGASWVLKSPTIIVLLLISPFLLVSICLTYWGAPVLGAYIFIIVISSSWLDPSLSHFTAFISKSILSWYEYCYSFFYFWSPFVWNIFFQAFTFHLYMSLGLRWVSCRQHI